MWAAAWRWDGWQGALLLRRRVKKLTWVSQGTAKRLETAARLAGALGRSRRSGRQLQAGDFRRRSLPRFADATHQLSSFNLLRCSSFSLQLCLLRRSIVSLPRCRHSDQQRESLHNSGPRVFLGSRGDTLPRRAMSICLYRRQSQVLGLVSDSATSGSTLIMLSTFKPLTIMLNLTTSDIIQYSSTVPRPSMPSPRPSSSRSTRPCANSKPTSRLVPSS